MLIITKNKIKLPAFVGTRGDGDMARCVAHDDYIAKEVCPIHTEDDLRPCDGGQTALQGNFLL